LGRKLAWDAFALARAPDRGLASEASLYFGETERIFRHVDMEDPSFDILDLAVANQWTALCFAPRDLLVATPYGGLI